MSSRQDDRPWLDSAGKPISIMDAIHACQTAIMELQDAIQFKDKVKGTPLEDEYKRDVEILEHIKGMYSKALEARIIAQKKAEGRPNLIIPGRRNN